MSFSRILAEKYYKKSLNENSFEEKIHKFGLDSILPIFIKKLKNKNRVKELYEICKIVSSKKIEDSEISNIKQKYNIPSEVKTEIVVDHNLLDGQIIYYQGNKWDDSVLDRLNRFEKN